MISSIFHNYLVLKINLNAYSTILKRTAFTFIENCIMRPALQIQVCSFGKLKFSVKHKDIVHWRMG